MMRDDITTIGKRNIKMVQKQPVNRLNQKFKKLEIFNVWWMNV